MHPSSSRPDAAHRIANAPPTRSLDPPGHVDPGTDAQVPVAAAENTADAPLLASTGSAALPSLFAGPSVPSDRNPRSSGASPASSSGRPLAVLAAAPAGVSKPASPPMDEPGHASSSAVGAPAGRRLPRVEKDVDDPSTPLESRRRTPNLSNDLTSITALSRLFATQASTSPSASRTPSGHLGSIMSRLADTESSTLTNHLYNRGLLDGRHSDVTVVAFGTRYALHRLILDRAPYFSNAFGGPWLESTSKEMVLHPEKMDGNITQAAFELALKRLYGGAPSEDEDDEAIGLFATGCWLEMQDLVETSIDAILRQMSPETLSHLIRLVTNNFYGRAGERILASAKAMLCRDGWEMSIKHWDDIPGDIVREIVGGDGFFINSEFERWILARRLLDRRLKQCATECGLMAPGAKLPTKAPDGLNLMAIRFDSIYRRSAVTSGQVPEHHQLWISLYTHPDIEPVLVLLDEGIHYVHLDFEQLQYIRESQDVFGLPVMPEKVMMNALWMSMELRQKVATARPEDLELGLSKIADRAPEAHSTTDHMSRSSHSAKGKEKQPETMDDTDADADDVELDSGSWDGNGLPRKFWIPSTDCNIVIGGSAEPVVTTSTSFQRHASRLSATLAPEDAQWATDFATANILDNSPRGMAAANAAAGSGIPSQQPSPFAFSHFPPFRFAAEFPNPRLLKERKRVYSRSVFYAGSLWNIYIQKVRSAKNPQLGVYLHRVRGTDEFMQNMGRHADGSVLNPEHLLNTEGPRRSRTLDLARAETRRRGNTRERLNVGDDTSGSGGEADMTSAHPLFSRRATAGRAGGMANANEAGGSRVGSVDSPVRTMDDHDEDSDSDEASDSPSSPAKDRRRSGSYIPRALRENRIPALPGYADSRECIKTYFKIYSPSKGGRMLSVYESAPDKFNFAQSWGWKSSTLMLDEGFSGSNPLEEGDEEGVKEVPRSARAMRGEGKLRFMVVIGNL